MGTIDLKAVITARKLGEPWRSLQKRFGISYHSLRRLLASEGLVHQRFDGAQDEIEGVAFFKHAAAACDAHLADLRIFHPELERKAA